MQDSDDESGIVTIKRRRSSTASAGSVVGGRAGAIEGMVQAMTEASMHKTALIQSVHELNNMKHQLDERRFALEAEERKRRFVLEEEERLLAL